MWRVAGLHSLFYCAGICRFILSIGVCIFFLLSSRQYSLDVLPFGGLEVQIESIWSLLRTCLGLDKVNALGLLRNGGKEEVVGERKRWWSEVREGVLTMLSLPCKVLRCGIMWQPGRGDLSLFNSSPSLLLNFHFRPLNVWEWESASPSCSRTARQNN